MVASKLDRVIELLADGATNRQTNDLSLVDNRILREEIIKKTLIKSKKDIAIEWLLNHQEDRDKSGKELEATIFPDGIMISRTYWNDAKKE